ncbi:MerR family transcriptional regulator [Sphingobium sp. DEHP117]|uniref:MerR family transcriptional regulator n=1 Tax=Sphingobium sp. DEHP117 TaxID=2993436 RepID=UPI0027D719B7|nr:MerR family transcriptional regulator [Sphingobium sp. DEHP117]MDQ4422194.1 MerR family transcriptional regulator [Sphingobium sp. DEHP117]
MTKQSGAFLTIGELSAELNVPQHVLRYWETRFPALRPLQRAGNRRYYRPHDVELARRIHLQTIAIYDRNSRVVSQALKSRLIGNPASSGRRISLIATKLPWAPLCSASQLGSAPSFTGTG